MTFHIKQNTTFGILLLKTPVYIRAIWRTSILGLEKKIKKSTQKKCSYFEKWNFLALIWKKLLYFLEGKLSLYFGKCNLLVFPNMEPCNSQPNPKKSKKLHRKKILVFPKMVLCRPNVKKIIIFSQKKAFAIFPKTDHCTFQPKLEE